MNKFNNVNELRAEITRLKLVAKQQEQAIKNDLKEIRKDLKPENILWNAVSSLTGIKMDKKEFFKDGIVYGLSIILRRFVLKSEKKVENVAYDFLDNIFDRVKNLVNKFAGHEAKRGERNEARD